MVSPSDHLVLSSTPMWSECAALCPVGQWLILFAAIGHFRALCVLSSKIVAERNVIVTLIVPNWGTTFEKATAEVGRCLSSEGSQLGVVR